MSEQSQTTPETTVTVEVETETEPQPEQSIGETSERTLGRLEAETGHLSEEVQEATETAETAESAAETATEIAFDAHRAISDLSERMETGFSELHSRLTNLESENEEDLKSSETEEVEIPLIVQEEPQQEANRGILGRILFG